jgi:two-component system alkaline phosphatase synthesis response regulator PhoP
MRRVLVVDDDPKVCETLDRYLAHAGYTTASALDGARALELARTFAPDLIVLDLMLPEIGGLDVCRTLRESSGVPIIMLTARSTEADKLAGLKSGADDYLTKPFSPRELVARVETVLRRVPASGATPCVVAGALNIDPARCEATIDGVLLPLTATELRLLLTMARSPGRVFRRDELATLALGDDFEGLDRTIDAHIKNLRQKLTAGTPESARSTAAPEGGRVVIVTVFGIGYKLVV